MVQLLPAHWDMRDYSAWLEDERAYQQRREEIMALPPLVIEQTWQLALFGDAMVVQELIVETGE